MKGFTQAGQRPPESPQGKKNNSNPQKYENRSEIICQICRKPRHSAIDCGHRFNQGFQPGGAAQALAALKFTDDQNEAWFPDTGATQHMTPDEGKLFNCRP